MYEFTRNEIRDLLIAFAVLSISFAICNVGLDLFGIASILPIVMIGVGAGFLLHEIGHKLWPIGLVIAFVTAFLGFVFAAPGAVNTYADHMTDEINGRIAIAGPMTNMALALIFIAIAALIYPFSLHSQIIHLIYLTCAVGYSVNSYLAAFNLLPFATLDGTKVMKWNVLIWFVVFAIAAIMTLLSMTIGAENMVGLIIGM